MGNRFIPFPKLDLPVFDGDNAQNWLRKMEKFFRLYGIDESQKVEVTVMHMEGRAEN